MQRCPANEPRDLTRAMQTLIWLRGSLDHRHGVQDARSNRHPAGHRRNTGAAMDIGVFIPIANNGWLISRIQPLMASRTKVLEAA
jgi:hypothetical protein